MNLATILAVGDKAVLPANLIQDFVRLGFRIETVPALAARTLKKLDFLPDILLLDGRADWHGAVAAMPLIRKADGFERVPVCLLSDTRSVDLLRAAFDSGIDDVLVPPFDDAKLLSRLRPLVRLSTMNHELRLRSEEARKAGVDCKSAFGKTETKDSCRLLIVGNAGTDWGKQFGDADVTVADDPYQADALLNGPTFDAAILAPSGDPTPFLDLCAYMRNNPRLFLLPVLVADVEGTMEESDAYRHKANDFFRRPVEFPLMAEAIKFLVRRQRRRWAYRDALAATMGAAVIDATTGLYAKPFFRKYLTRQVKFASKHSRKLSVILLRIADISRIRHQFGKPQAAHLKKQLAQWITGLARVEDFAAISGENEFCLVLADTPNEEASIVMHRIAGALAYTDFAVRDVYQPVKVWVQETCAEYEAGEKAGDFLERIRNTIT